MRLKPEKVSKAIRIMEERGTLSDATRRRFLAATAGGMATGLAGCSGLSDDDEPEEERDTVDLTFRIPSAVERDGTPIEDDRIAYHDYSSVKHGLYMAGAVARSSEFGHENYRPELADDHMLECGELWVEMIDDITDTFWDDGEIAEYLELTDDGWVRGDDLRVGDYYTASTPTTCTTVAPGGKEKATKTSPTRSSSVLHPLSLDTASTSSTTSTRTDGSITTPI